MYRMTKQIEHFWGAQSLFSCLDINSPLYLFIELYGSSSFILQNFEKERKKYFYCLRWSWFPRNGKFNLLSMDLNMLDFHNLTELLLLSTKRRLPFKKKRAFFWLTKNSLHIKLAMTSKAQSLLTLKYSLFHRYRSGQRDDYFLANFNHFYNELNFLWQLGQ
jgi:hypothetical protein